MIHRLPDTIAVAALLVWAASGCGARSLPGGNLSARSDASVADGIRTADATSDATTPRPVPVPVPVPPAPRPPPEPELLGERVTCVFDGSHVVQECYSSIGDGCKGVAHCSVWVSGVAGTEVDWKSSCGGHARTVIDGVDEVARFFCSEPPPPPEVAEEVTCVFLDSSSPQECYSATASASFSCNGVGSCAIKVSGPPGTTMTWKSSCGGYAYTVIDGWPEKAVFDCADRP